MNLTGTRPWIFGGALVALAMVGLTWLLVVGPTRSDTASLRDDTAAAQTQNDVLATRTAALAAQAAQRTQLETDVREALSAVPSDTDLPAFNSELALHASERGIRVTSIAVGAATAPGNASTPDPTGLLGVPVTIQASGPRLALLYFLRDLQEVGPRAALVDSVSVGEDDSGTASTAATDAGASTVVDETETIGNTVPTTMTAQVTIFAHALDETDTTLLADVVASTPDAG